MRFLIALLLFSSPVLADAVYTWEAPTTRENGDPLPASEIAGYLFSYSINGTLVTATPLTIAGLTHTVAANGKICASVQTVDTDGLQSDPTVVLCKKARPGKPNNFKVR